MEFGDPSTNRCGAAILNNRAADHRLILDHVARAKKVCPKRQEQIFGLGEHQNLPGLSCCDHLNMNRAGTRGNHTSRFETWVARRCPVENVSFVLEQADVSHMSLWFEIRVAVSRD
jgi:hypothetical protein